MQRLVILCAVVALTSVLTVSSARASEVRPSAPLHEAEADSDGGRMRAGIEAVAGAGFATGSVSGSLIGMALRAGWQIDRRAAVCLQGSVFLWNSSETPTGPGSSAKGAFGFHITPLFSLTPSDAIEVAAGPSLDYSRPIESTVLVDAGAPRDDRSIHAAHAPGMHGRFAVLFSEVSKERPRARVGLALSAQMHATFVDRGVVSMFTLGLGSEWY